jgi:adenylylsulfate kinase-like enzyme
MIRDLPGVDAPYEAPDTPEIVVDTDRQTPEEAAKMILDSLALLNCTAMVSA